MGFRDGPLLERTGQLDALAGWASGIGRGGRFVLVPGEAGVGKTALVQRFLRMLPSRTPAFQGACEALSTPHPLAPLIDVAAQVGGSVAAAVAAGADPVTLSRALLKMFADPG